MTYQSMDAEYRADPDSGEGFSICVRGPEKPPASFEIEMAKAEVVSAAIDKFGILAENCWVWTRRLGPMKHRATIRLYGGQKYSAIGQVPVGALSNLVEVLKAA